MAQEIIEPPGAAERRKSSWWGAGPNQQQRQDPEMNDATFNRFLGGSPAGVFVRLLFISLIVGVFLMWLDVRPGDVFFALERLVRRILNLGFDSVREILSYILAGAALVVPIWLVIRLLNMRGAR